MTIGTMVSYIGVVGVTLIFGFLVYFVGDVINGKE